jgi:hypothetical protein
MPHDKTRQTRRRHHYGSRKGIGGGRYDDRYPEQVRTYCAGDIKAQPLSGKKPDGKRSEREQSELPKKDVGDLRARVAEDPEARQFTAPFRKGDPGAVIDDAEGDGPGEN